MTTENRFPTLIEASDSAGDAVNIASKPGEDIAGACRLDWRNS